MDPRLLKPELWAFEPSAVDPQWWNFWSQMAVFFPFWSEGGSAGGSTDLDLVSRTSVSGNSGSGTSWATDQYGIAFSNTSAGSSANFANPNATAFIGQNFTVIYYGTITGNEGNNGFSRLLWGNFDGSNPQGWNLNVSQGDNHLGLEIPGSELSSGVDIRDSKQHLVAVEFISGVSATFYIDGVQVAQVSTAGTIGSGSTGIAKIFSGSDASRGVTGRLHYVCATKGVFGPGFHAQLAEDPFGPMRMSDPQTVPPPAMLANLSETDVISASMTVPTIGVTDQTAAKIFQRSAGTTAKTITFSGTYTGPVPSSVEVEIINNAGGGVQQAFTALSSATISGGSWSGSLSVPQGGMYNFIARTKNAGGVVLATSAQSSNLWGVGIVVACGGQSNMLYWYFDNGSPPTPDSRVSGYNLPVNNGGSRSGGWQQVGFGNGLVEFVNALRTGIASAGGGIIPVGLINEGQGGSSMTQWIGGGIGGNNYYHNNLIPDVTGAGGDFEIFMWYLGETDAPAYTSGLATSLNTLYGFVQTTTGRTAAQLPFINMTIGTASSLAGNDVNWNAYQRDQESWASSTTGAYIGGWQGDITRVDQFHLSTSPSNLTANYQFSAARDALSVIKALGLSTHGGQGPQVISGSFVAGSSQVTAVIAQDAGTALAVGGTGSASALTGWRVFDNGVQATITSTAFVQPNQVQLNLSASLASGHTVTFDYLFGTNPNAATDGTLGGPDGLVFDNTTAVSGGLPLQVSAEITATQGTGSMASTMTGTGALAGTLNTPGMASTMAGVGNLTGTINYAVAAIMTGHGNLTGTLSGGTPAGTGANPTFYGITLDTMRSPSGNPRKFNIGL